MSAKLSDDKYQNHLKEQIYFLQSSVKLYDLGNYIEAKRLALTIRVLLFDEGKGQSLLGQMHLKKRMNFVSTAQEFSENNLLTQQCLLKMVLDGPNSHFEPLFEGGSIHYLSFNQWKNEIVICDKDRKTYTRRDLIKLLANQDGGAHIDPEIDPKVKPLKDAFVSGWLMVDQNGNEIPLKNDIVYCSMRQIAYEVLKSIYGVRPKSFEERYF